MKKRKLEVVVISDVHLGSLECHAEELIGYLSSIQPKKLILNGSIIAINELSSHYFPPTHINVIRKILALASKGTEVYYLPADKDDVLQKFVGLTMGKIHFTNNLVLTLNGKKAWFCHGDIFDSFLSNIKWISYLGSTGYQILRTFNKLAPKNKIVKRSDHKNLSQVKKVQLKQVPKIESTAVHFAINQNYDFAVCGHTHHPKKEVWHTKKRKCTYLNSGDWVKNLTALEYSLKRWKIYRYDQDKLSPFYADEELKKFDMQELVATIMTKNSSNQIGDESIGQKSHKNKESID